MVKPVSSSTSQGAHLPKGNMKTYSSHKTSSSSSINSAKITFSFNPFQVFLSFFEAIYHTIKTLFVQEECKKSSNSFSPEVKPFTLDLKDPFCIKMFNEDYSLKEKKAYKLCVEIFTILSKGGTMYWATKYSKLKEGYDTLQKLNFHPFEFLYAVLHNKEQTDRVTKFQKNAPAKIWNTYFLNFQIELFEEHSKDTAKYIPGFCKLLGLNQEDTASFVKEQNWKGLILFVVDERKKATNHPVSPAA